MRSNSLSKRIAASITKRIQDGEFPPGAHLRAEQMSEIFKVSRSPIRQAFQILAAQGIVEQKVNRGFFVSEDPALPAPRQDLAEHTDAPEIHFRFAEDWLNDRIPADVTEQFLRDRYHLTKAQVFELLTRAANEGWAERKEGRGWRLLAVAKATETLEQIYRFRAIIEPASLLEPGFALDRAAIAEQRRIQEGMYAGDIERMSADRLLVTGVNFHEALVRMSNSPFFLQSVVRANRMRRLLNYRTLVDRARFYDQAREHLQMLDLLERGENLECSYLLKRHLTGALAQRAIWQESAPKNMLVSSAAE
ncbi:GntR family transcriptional regulator [Ancylobacter sp. MQZ15Z-1]|uniref:GntR family transcriptional regulator n=1 Tax=Ancylobacter mangrovi TaxID=2972472 RepID=A0A9X2PFX3_9HYPH|nr:GntR family transcriptional regulator [Ancylobacter mangrovi]MCS0497185.1 GntR family transcriptional regulator [Ancylobacter mangrovi]